MLDFLKAVADAIQRVFGSVAAATGGQSGTARNVPGTSAFRAAGALPQEAPQAPQVERRPTPGVGWTDVPDLPPAPALKPRTGVGLGTAPTIYNLLTKYRERGR